MPRSMTLALIVLAAIGLVGCGVADIPAGPPSAFESETPASTPADRDAHAPPPQAIDPLLRETRWKLVELDGAALITGSNITLVFEGDQIGGYGGCNWYGGPYTVAHEGSLVISDFPSTQRACLDQRVQEQETSYFTRLRQVQSYGIRDDRLELMDTSGAVTLVFAYQPRQAMNPSDLIDTDWRVETLNGEPPLPGTLLTLAFTADTAHGSTGCRDYQSTYQAEGDTIRFQSTTMLALDCMRPRRNLEQEGRFTDGLSGATTYVLSDDRLEISTVDGVFSFVPLVETPLESTEATMWRLREFVDGTTRASVISGTTITLQFDGGMLQEQGQVAGNAGCNTYHAAYTYTNDLVFSPPASTRMACLEPEGVMEQERRYLDWLHAVTTYRLSHELRLETDDGRVLIFEEVAPPANARP